MRGNRFRNGYGLQCRTAWERCVTQRSRCENVTVNATGFAGYVTTVVRGAWEKEGAGGVVSVRLDGVCTAGVENAGRARNAGNGRRGRVERIR